MKGKKLSAMPMFFVMGVTALFIFGAVYYYMQSPHFSTLDPRREEKIVTPPAILSESLIEFYQKRMDFSNNTFGLKDPERIGFKKLGSIQIACPPDSEGPCGGEILLISKEAVKSGNQQFYFAQAGGAGYGYFGPFTGNLKRLVAESKSINTLNY